MWIRRRDYERRQESLRRSVRKWLDDIQHMEQRTQGLEERVRALGEENDALSEENEALRGRLKGADETIERLSAHIRELDARLTATLAPCERSEYREGDE